MTNETNLAVLKIIFLEGFDITGNSFYRKSIISTVKIFPMVYTCIFPI